MEARGVGRMESEDGTPGKVVFVEGALPGERVSYSTHRSKPKFEQAEVVQVFRESVMRTKPKCVHFDICGGCSMQHLDIRAQVAVKQRVLEDNLQHLAKLRPETVFRPIHGPAWDTATARVSRCASCRKKAACASAFTRRKAATSRI